MKTIEEAKEDCRIYFANSSLNILGVSDEAFVKGVEFAQRWIPIEEELPENFTTVIARDNGISPVRSLALYQDSKFYPDFSVLTNENITHWRPINYI